MFPNVCLSRDIMMTHSDDQMHIITDSKVLFYRQLFDGIHHWLYHLFDVGMRIRQSEINNDNDNDQDDYLDDNKDNNEYIDLQFKRIKKNISIARNRLKFDVNRFKTTENNKFSLRVIEQQSEKGHETYIESLLKYLKEMNISDEMIEKLKIYLKHEHFDTEALIQDSGDFHSKSNILTELGDSEVVQLIRLEAVDYKSMLKMYVISVFFIIFIT